VSAITGGNVESLVSLLVELLPEGPKYYPDDMITDQPERAIVKEIIREKVLHLTREEIPHCVAVEIEEIKPRKNELVYIRAVIFTERDSQKGIIVGKNGQILKKIGELARGEMENLLGSKVYLDLWVKVRKDWRNKDSFLKDFGYVLKE
jgi:GTP-binding protein Era